MLHTTTKIKEKADFQASELFTSRQLSIKECWIEAFLSLKQLFRKSPSQFLIGKWQATAEYEYMNNEWLCFYTYLPEENIYHFDKKNGLTTIYTQNNCSEKEQQTYIYIHDKQTIRTSKSAIWYIDRITARELVLIERIVHKEGTEFIKTTFRKIR